MKLSFEDIDIKKLTIDNRAINTVCCSEGHIFSVALNVFRAGLWCIRCDGLNKSYKMIAKANEGEILQKVRTTKELVSLKCKNGHCWKGRYTNLKKGYWCKICGVTRRRIQPEEILYLAEKNGGECLSDLSCYTNCQKQKLLWRCSKGHEWNTTVFSVKQGGWCKKCSHNAGSIEEAQEYALSKGGKCLSTYYKNAKTKLKLQCSEGHTWTTNMGNIRFSKPWCEKCVGRAAYAVEDMKELAGKKGGKFLSKSYTHSKKRYLWECENQHQWETSASSILKGTWCPRCNEQRTQSRGAEIIEKYLKRNEIGFKKEKEFIGCKDIHNLRFDFYCIDLGVLIEHDGQQHWKCIEYWGGMEKFQKRINRDCIKTKYCLDNKIPLIRISNKENILEKVDSLLELAQSKLVIMQPLIGKEYKGHVEAVFASKIDGKYVTYYE